jgi:hypothetical protein
MNRVPNNIARIGNRLFQRVGFLYVSPRFPWILIGLGIILRLTQYLFNRSLWLDESLLALNIIEKSFSELVRPLDYWQGAPVGFLMLERSAVQVLGPSEYALRLFPLLSGVASLFLFYEVAKQYIKPKAVPIALGLFVLSDPLIYYSSEVKQYSSDVVVALLLYLVTIRTLSRGLTIRGVALLGSVGATAIWFSHPSTFILAGVGLSLFLFSLSSREWARVGSLLVVYLIWGLSFVACYFVSLRNLSNDETMLNYWAGAFMPFPPLDPSWFTGAFFGIFEDCAGLALPGIAALAFLVGCTLMLAEKRPSFFYLMSPAFVTLLASALHKYPFKGRLLLFIAPSVLLLTAQGAAWIRDKTRQTSPVTGIVLMGLLFFHPVYYASYHLVRPRTREEIKPVINYVRAHREDRDILYLFPGPRYAFRYYAERYGFSDNDYIVGVDADSWVEYPRDLSTLRGSGRVWILFSHFDQAEMEFLLEYLDSIGMKLDSYECAGAAVYLYDLREQTQSLAKCKASILLGMITSSRML